MPDYATIPSLSLNDDKNETENMSDSSEEVDTVRVLSCINHIFKMLLKIV